MPNDYWSGPRGHERDMRDRKMDKQADTVVFDIDGVLADNSARLAALDLANPDWVTFHLTQDEDPLRAGEAALLGILYDSGHNIVLLTNRPEVYRDQTEDWLSSHNVDYHALLMRAPGQDYHRAKIDSVMMLELQGWNVALVVDDDPQHCENINAECGVPVLYVHSGYYDGERADPRHYVEQDHLHTADALVAQAQGVKP